MTHIQFYVLIGGILINVAFFLYLLNALSICIELFHMCICIELFHTSKGTSSHAYVCGPNAVVNHGESPRERPPQGKSTSSTGCGAFNDSTRINESRACSFTSGETIS